MKYSILVLAIFLTVCPLTKVMSQKTDSLHVYIVGEFKRGMNYQFRYKRKVVFEFGHRNKVVDTCLVFDTSDLKPYSFMEFDIYKKQRFSANYYYSQSLIYYPELKYTEIYYLPYVSKDLLIYYFPNKRYIHVIDIHNKI
ncbi:hypothetical protein SDC9_48396 [bioreactor metagenome]|uniref:Uncharacterized protein n=1 Tax=bioreactor metagenome TaxID=1076179 RepID=A0A644WF94_9ZZZZ